MEENKLEIKYSYPPAWRKFMARVIDFLVFALLFVAFFIPTRSIVMNTNTYKNCQETVEKYQLDCGVWFKNDNGELVDAVTYYSQFEYASYTEQNYKLNGVIGNFIDYVEEKCGSYKAEQVQKDYNDFLLSDEFVFDGEPYFVEWTPGEVAFNNHYCDVDSKTLYEDVYSFYIDSHIQGFFISLFPEVRAANRTINLLVIFVEIPIAAILSALLTYILPTHIFKRNRYTLGRLAYHIGLLGPDLLSVKANRNLAKNVIFFFFEIVLSVFSFGIPLIISFTMSLCTKRKQTFSEYMSGTIEVDSLKCKIYYNKSEIKLDSIDVHQKAPDFNILK